MHLVAILLRADEPAHRRRQLVGRREREVPRRPQVAVVIIGVVPTIGEPGGHAEPFCDRISREQPGVEIGRAERVEKRPREVEILRTLVDLVADEGRPLSRLQREPLAHRHEVGEVRLCEIVLRRVAEERPAIVAVAEDPQRVILLRVHPARDDHAPAEAIALGRVLLDAELGGVERVAVVVVVEPQLVDIAAARAAEVGDIAVLDVREQHDLLEVGLRLTFGRSRAAEHVGDRLLGERGARQGTDNRHHT